jgi:hypothetical protein
MHSKKPELMARLLRSPGRERLSNPCRQIEWRVPSEKEELLAFAKAGTLLSYGCALGLILEDKQLDRFRRIFWHCEQYDAIAPQEISHGDRSSEFG